MGKALIMLWMFAVACATTARGADGGPDGKPVVVVLSMDAFRWDYPHHAHTPTLDSLAAAGTTAVVRSSFPANTFPNHYTMATGLYPDHHGIVDNRFYDKALHRQFSYKDSLSLQYLPFWRGEPIWTTAGRQDVRSAVFYWVGSETPGHHPDIWKKYDRHVSYRQRADTVLSWLSLPEQQRPQLIMWYIENPDTTSHACGPLDGQTLRCVEQLDSLLGYFFREARRTPAFDRINFIVTADHGMVAVEPERYINLAQVLDTRRIRYAFGSIPMQIEPEPGYADEAYRLLRRVPHIRVWKRDRVPKRYHYGTDTSRIAPLIVLPDDGYRTGYHKSGRKPDEKGMHGFDPFTSDMHAIFFGCGPAFRRNYRGGTFPNVNLYGLIARLLGIEPAPNDGNPKVIEKLLIQ